MALGVRHAYINDRMHSRLTGGGPGLQRGDLPQDKAVLEDFKRGKLKLDAQASAVALTERASADLAYRNGVAIVTMAEGGLMYEASVGGQKLSCHPIAKAA